ncbi:hypothetical protein [Parafrankia sp. FMc2]|uniref:hypothetical protein n=1 Tax=Parafrankia sp. FMc2 TaxID=3233196 RepID=UPI0034D5B976
MGTAVAVCGPVRALASGVVCGEAHQPQGQPWPPRTGRHADEQADPPGAEEGPPAGYREKQ